jgi:glycosyltransferase involved in cell wall biosynthesis
MRRQDLRQSRKITTYIANSNCVRERILKFYNREAQVIHPPVDVERFQPSNHSEDYFLIVSRLVGYKRIDRAVIGCSKLGLNLHVVGSGPDLNRLKSLAGPTVKFLGRLSDEEVTEQMSRCKGFIFPGLEDFGISPVEANACGKPVLALRGGGALDTIVDGLNGVFFDENNEESFTAGVKLMQQREWNVSKIRNHANKFSTSEHLIKIDKVLRDVTATCV